MLRRSRGWDLTVQDLELAESCDGGRYRFGGPIVLDRGGAYGYNVRLIQRNDLLTSVAEPGSWPSPDTPAQSSKDLGSTNGTGNG